MDNTTNTQIEIFESAGNLVAGARGLATGTRITVKSTGASGVVAQTDAERFVETMYLIDLDDGGSAILKRGEIHDPHTLSFSCTCTACVEARKTLGRMWR